MQDSDFIVVKVFDELGVRGRIADIVFGELIVEDLAILRDEERVLAIAGTSLAVETAKRLLAGEQGDDERVEAHVRSAGPGGGQGA